jgi:hypothetical protein
MSATILSGLRAAAIAMVLVAVAACSSTGATPSTGASPDASPASSPSAATSTLCADVAAFRTSVQALRSVDLIAGGTDALKTAVEDVRTAGANLKASATADLAPDVSALVTAIEGLKTAVDKIGTGSIGSNILPIRAAIASVSTAWDQLQAKVKTPCPS